MAYKYFRLNVVLRSVFLIFTIVCIVYLFTFTNLYATIVVVAIALILQIYALIHYVEKTNRDLARFLDSIRYSDFSQSFTVEQKGSIFKNLHNSFSEVLAEFRKTRSEKEQQYRYLNTLVHHIALGIITFDQSGKVDLINNAAKRMLGITHLNNVKNLRSLSGKLTDTLFSDSPGKKELIRIKVNDEQITLAVHTTTFMQRNRSFTIASMQNIEKEMSEQEMDAWEKLIRVLTHEIMNSVTPIASLASTINEIAKNADNENDTEAGLDNEAVADIREAAEVIESRSHGLLHFVNAYRDLTLVPKPNFKIINVNEMLEKMCQLWKNKPEGRDVEIEITVKPENLQLNADPELIEQVIINVVLNSIQALESTPAPRISINAYIDDQNRVRIDIEDNGCGIPDDLKSKIFTPFFTTKKYGSGIGLSLSRQILRMHNASITVQSTPEIGTVFSLRF